MKKAKTQPKKMNKIALYSLSFSVLVIVLVFGLRTSWASWQEPSLPPPQGNTPFLIDVGPDNQAKIGHLRLDPEFNTNNLPPPDIAHVLEVRGAGAKISTLNVNGSLTVDDNTLFVNSNTGRVGIGTNTPSAKLSIEGGSLTVGKGTPIVAQAISATASGADSHGIYGVSTAPNSAGVYGESKLVCSGGSNNGSACSSNNDCPDGVCLSGYGVWGDTLTCAGVYGEGTDIGVKGVTVSGDYGVYGINNTKAGNFWAGYFAGRLEATDEVIGSKFLPTKLQNSLVPYTAGWKMGDYTAGATPRNLAFDGAYIWVANSGANTISKIRAVDGVKIFDKDIGAAPLDIIFDGNYIWVSYNGVADGKISKINPADGNILASYNVGFSPNNIIYAFDGTDSYIWASASVSNNVIRTKISDGTQCTSAGLINPQGLAFDGKYVWVANFGGNGLRKLKSDCAQANVVNTSSPWRIVFDGTYLWATNFNSDTVTKILVSSEDTGDVVVSLSYATGDGPKGIIFDGTYLWIANGNAGTISRIIAADPNERVDSASLGFVPSKIIFDGTYIWVGHDSGNTISKFYTGTGFGHTDLSSLVNLQTSTPGTAQTGSFSTSGTGTIDTNLEVGGDLSVTNNVWGDDDTGDESIDFIGNSADCATSGYFIKGIEVGASGNLNKILCRPL